MLKERNTEKEKQEEALNSQKDNRKDSCHQESFSCFKNSKTLDTTLSLIAVSLFYIFHYVEYYKLSINPENFIKNTIILTSYDAYFYANQIKEFIIGNLNINEIQPLGMLGGILSKIFDEGLVLTFSSVIFGSFLGIVIYCLAFLILQQINTQNEFKNKILAFFASILSIFSPHYFQRTIVGYFDTDMLMLSLPILCLIFLWQYTLNKKTTYLVLFGLIGIVSTTWHNGIQNILLASFILYVIHSCIYKKIEIEIISIFLIILTPSSYAFYILILIILLKKYKYVCLILSVLYAYYFGLFNPFITQINAYLFGEIQHSKKFIYSSVVNSILETSPASLNNIVDRSGGMIVFCAGMIGFCLIGSIKSIKNRTVCSIYFLLFPFLILGMASMKLGVRFSMFLAPIISIGTILLISHLMDKFKKHSNKILFIFASSFGLFFANLSYKTPQPILTKQEIQSLIELPIKEGDVVFSWWDYGYAISYFTDGTTLLDGGRHAGIINYPIANILLSQNQNIGSNLSILLADQMKHTNKAKWNFLYESLLNGESPINYMENLKNKEVAIQKDYNIFWILPYRILPLIANINTFSNINPENGKILRDKRYFIFNKNTLLMDQHYASSNIIKWLIFNDNPKMDLILKNDRIVAYKIKD